MWFWFLILAIITGLAMVYRYTTWFSIRARSSLLVYRSNFLLDPEISERVCGKLRKGDWFFLNMIGANMNPRLFTQLVEKMDKSFQKRLMNGGSGKVEKIA